MSTPEPTTRELLPPADAPPSPGTELSLPERARAAIRLSQTEADLKELAARTSTITEVTNADGRTQVHAAAMALREQRLAIEKAGGAARDDANRFAKEVIVQQNKLIAIIEPEETRLKKLRDEWDAKIETEKRAKAEAERKRIAAINARIQEMRDKVSELAGLSAAGVAEGIQQFTQIAIDDSFGELKQTAEQVHANVLARLRSMHAEYVKHEADQERIRAEQERRKAELDAEIARQRQERELNTARMKVIAAINRLPLVATTGRNPDRKAGTRECITATLEEARNFEVNEADFGTLLDAATEAKRAAVEQIEHILERFDERARQAVIAEREARELEQLRQQQVERERQLQEQEAAAAAERERLAAEQRRQQEEQAKIEADRKQVELLQASLAAQPAPAAESPPATEPEAAAVLTTATIDLPIVHAGDQVPCKLCATPTRALHTLLCDGCYDLSKLITVATAGSAISLGCEVLGIADRAGTMLKAARKAQAQLQAQAGGA